MPLTITYAEADAARIAEAIANPVTTTLSVEEAPQSLGGGPLGIALMHLERLRTKAGEVSTAREWFRASAHPHINSSAATNLYNGAPAVAFVLHSTGAHHRYSNVAERLQKRVGEIVTTRINLARSRLAQGLPARFSEFSLISGLTGFGAYYLAAHPGNERLGDVLSYLVDLSSPEFTIGGLPAWWAHHDPHLRQTSEFKGGHGNFGVAHGIAGPLALLSLAQQRGVSVPGQKEAIESYCSWFDAWQHPHGWWPQWITAPELEDRVSHQPGPGRPSWCYGAPGIARSLQLAALALGDSIRQRAAEDALLRCLADDDQQASLTETGLCHGLAGLYRIVQRASAEAQDSRLAEAMPDLLDRLLNSDRDDNSFLNGDAGKSLVLGEAAPIIPTTSVWDSALLLSASEETPV